MKSSFPNKNSKGASPGPSARLPLPFLLESSSHRMFATMSTLYRKFVDSGAGRATRGNERGRSLTRPSLPPFPSSGSLARQTCPFILGVTETEKENLSIIGRKQRASARARYTIYDRFERPIKYIIKKYVNTFGGMKNFFFFRIFKNRSILELPANFQKWLNAKNINIFLLNISTCGFF